MQIISKLKFISTVSPEIDEDYYESLQTNCPMVRNPDNMSYGHMKSQLRFVVCMGGGKTASHANGKENLYSFCVNCFGPLRI